MAEYGWLIVPLREYAEKQREQLIYEAADAIEELIPFKKQVEKGMGLLDKAEELLNAVKPRWIPVTERLPEEDGMYLVHGTWSASGRKVTDTCEFFVHDGYFRAAWNFDVSHWMPLPEPPKEETK